MNLKHLIMSVALIAPISSPADILNVGDMPKVMTKSNAPKAGMSMNAVRVKYGEPSERKVAPGKVTAKNPKITQWKYGHSTVYFENSRVVHTVVHR